MSTSFGIDLGTTFSSIARLNKYGECELVPNQEGKKFTPSAVWFTEKALIQVGESAEKAALRHPSNVIQTAKQHMGDPDWIWEFGGHFYHPQDITSIILKKIKQDTEIYTQSDVTHAVITVPSHFNDRQRTATLEAAQLAGIEVHQLLNEPTAAVLAFGDKKVPDDGWLAVFDLGGGTFDVTILEAQNGFLHVRGTNGHGYLGGNNWSELLINHVAVKSISELGFDPLDDPFLYQKLKMECHRAKHRLSLHSEAEISLNFDGHLFSTHVTRDSFESMSHSLLGQIEDLSSLAMDELSLMWASIPNIYLVGGASQMPMFAHTIEKLTNQRVQQIPYPEQAVVRGAALQAAIYSLKKTPSFFEKKNDSPRKFLQGKVISADVNSHSLGLVVLDRGRQEMVDQILSKNTPLPCSQTFTYYTAYDSQTTIYLQIVEGESSAVDECIEIGQAEIIGLPPRPYGQPIEITFSYDQSGQFHIQVHDLGAGHQQNITFERTATRSFRELETMRRLLLAQTVA